MDSFSTGSDGIRKILLQDQMEYGKYYCVNVDKAVFRGFREDFTCTILSKQLSFGGTRCERVYSAIRSGIF